MVGREVLYEVVNKLDFSRPLEADGKRTIDEYYFINPKHYDVWKARYALKGPSGQPVEHHIYDCFVRITDEIVDDVELRVQILKAMCMKQLLPAGRQMAQAGTGTKNYSNCFVLGIEDDSDSISEFKRQHFKVQRQGGGTGLDWSNLRPRISVCKTVSARASGPIGFLIDTSHASKNIQQGGNRSGANMGTLDARHPSLKEWIHFKADNNWENIRKFADITDEAAFARFQWKHDYSGQRFNITTGVPDIFMDDVLAGGKDEWSTFWGEDEWFLYDYKVLDKRSGSYTNRTVTAPNIEDAELLASAEAPFFNANLELIRGPYRQTTGEWFHEMAQAAWEDGCPGIAFTDIIRAFHNGEYCHPMSSCNPCGEQWMPVDASCILSSIVIASFVKQGTFDIDEFKRIVRIGVQWLECVADKTHVGIEGIDTMREKERRIGLGTTGMADALMLMGEAYSSIQGRAVAESILRTFKEEVYWESIELAKEKGPFPVFDFEGYSQSAFFKRLPADVQEAIAKHGIRHITGLTQAPVGTGGTITGFTTGCEPGYFLAFRQNSRVGSYVNTVYAFGEWLRSEGLWESFLEYLDEDLPMDEIKHILQVPDYFEAASEISVEDHIKMLAVFQRHNDSGVSKTINLPNSATVEDVEDAYKLAYQLGCKSVTVYRDGSKIQVLEAVGVKEAPAKISRRKAPKRGRILPAELHRARVKGVPWLVVVGLLDGELYEVFAGAHPPDDFVIRRDENYVVSKDSSGIYNVLDGNEIVVLENIADLLQTDEQSAFTRLLSTSLRHGTPPRFIVQQLAKCQGSMFDFSTILSRILKKYLTQEQQVEVAKAVDPECLSCGSSFLIYEENCVKCDCGWSKCG